MIQSDEQRVYALTRRRIYDYERGLSQTAQVNTRASHARVCLRVLAWRVHVVHRRAARPIVRNGLARRRFIGTRTRRESVFFFFSRAFLVFTRCGWPRWPSLWRVPRRARRRRRGRARTRDPRPRKEISRISSLGPRCTSWPPRLSTPGHPFSSRDAKSAPRHRVSTASRPVARGPEPARAGSRARCGRRGRAGRSRPSRT